MNADKSLVTIENGEAPSSLVPCRNIRHRHFPELCGEGSTVVEAAEHLLNLLLRARSGVSSAWRRHDVDRVMNDVREFVADREHADQAVEDPRGAVASKTDR